MSLRSYSYLKSTCPQKRLSIRFCLTCILHVTIASPSNSKTCRINNTCALLNCYDKTGRILPAPPRRNSQHRFGMRGGGGYNYVPCFGLLDSFLASFHSDFLIIPSCELANLCTCIVRACAFMWAQVLRTYSYLLYLNQDWQPRDGGELRIHKDSGRDECVECFFFIVLPF